MKNIFEKISPRERKFILGGGIVLLALLFYIFIGSPFILKVNELKQSVNNKHLFYQWLKTTHHQLTQLKKSGVSVKLLEKENLAQAVEDLLKKDHLNSFLNKMEPQKGVVMLYFQSVPFDRLITWLSDIWQGEAIKVSKLSVTKGTTEGWVTARLYLKL